MKSPPYNPSSNGQAERSVRIVKDVLKKFLFDQEICIGSVTTKAHRSQLRVQKDSKNSPNVAVPCRSHCKRRLVSEEDFLGFPDDVAAKRFRKGDHEGTEPKTPSPRRSERLKVRPRRVYKR
ncbi:uncharacterized protein LOC129723915 [Wyeomyia smithii]|uniref:uncharacterized protein LOC129723915 n=1 Tax=Wyeomyia smithii TaxID=174621 RepID=UPI002467CA7F|nr:uncharacterized protein LOC129723915 [Wyeomyia smithii]